MILVWYNPNDLITYTKFYNYYILNDYFVGYVNSYNHIVIQMFILSDNKIYNVNDYNHYCHLKYRKNKFKLSTFFKSLIKIKQT